MDKRRIYAVELRSSKESFYRYAVKMVLNYSLGKITGARLKIDGHGDRAFRRELRAYLRPELQGRPEDAPIVSDLKVVDSKENGVLEVLGIHRAYTRRRTAALQQPPCCWT